MQEAHQKKTMDGTQRRSQRVVRPDLKKRRPPLSCIQCYQRKLKCGRELPARSRCVKMGCAHECTYRSDRPTQSHNSGESASSWTGQVVRTPPSGPRETDASPIIVAREAGEEHATHPDRDMTFFKNRDTLTKFHGFSYHMNFYQQFAELRPYIAQIKAKNPTINKTRDEIFALKDEINRKRSIERTMVNEATLRYLVPARSVADILIQTYIDRFEITHRVLHIPSFIAAYNQHWEDPMSTPAPFLVQLLLVLATAASFRPDVYTNNARDQPTHSLALRWIETCDQWLQYPPSQPPESLMALMNHLLLLVAKRSNYVEESCFWISTGALVRCAMAAGYHRDPSHTARSLFHREMRRRLWITTVELDLQACVERGMPPTVRKQDFDTNLPLHIDDDKIQDSTHDPPVTMSLDTLTDISFQVTLYRSLNTRLDVCAFINGSHEEKDFDEVLQLGEKLALALQDIPVWDYSYAEHRQQQRAMHVKNMLSLYLRQYILLLHIPFAIRKQPTLNSHISRGARLEAAAAILDHFRILLDSALLPGSACQTGFVLAALNICHEMYMSSGDQNASSTVISVRGIAESFISIVERALEPLEKRVTATLKGLNEYYTLAMVIGLVKSKRWPESSITSDEEAANRVIRINGLLLSAIATLEMNNAQLGTGRNIHSEPDFMRARSSMAFDDVSELYTPMLPGDFELLEDDINFNLFST